MEEEFKLALTRWRSCRIETSDLTMKLLYYDGNRGMHAARPTRMRVAYNSNGLNAMAEGPTFDVFLSHNRADKDVMERIARRLQKEVGIKPFLDKWHLIPGEPWQEALEDALDRSATVAVFVGPSGISPWHNEEMRAALEGRARDKAYRVIPVLLPGATLPKRGRLPLFLARLTWVDFQSGLDDFEAFRRLVSGIRGVAPGPGPEMLSPLGDRPPYRGLEKFGPQDAEWFFGRESETQQLIEHLKTACFLAVLGPSGSGKSSVVLAGLVPALQKGKLPGSADWPVLIVTPTEQPLEELAVHLADLVPSGSVGTLLEDLETDEKTLHLTARQALKNAPATQRVLLLVDQFEEVFTLCREEAAREKFFANLLYASGVEGGRTIVVLTMRADFLVKSAQYPELTDRLSTLQFFVTPMVGSQLREAIEQPATRSGLELEPGLADVILGDVEDQPGRLPLLEHALLELWKRRDGHRLTFKAYHEINGVTGALARTADATYESFTEPQRTIARRILLQLVQPGEGTNDTRRPAKRSELITRPEEAERVDFVLRRLANERLLTIGWERETAEAVVNLAHEALVRSWPNFQRWIDENRESLRTRARLREAAEEWARLNHDPGALYRGARLEQASEWAEEHANDLNSAERKFLRASRELQKNELKAAKKRAVQLRNRLFYLAGALLLAIAMAIAAALFGVRTYQSTIEAERQTRLSLARELAARSLGLLEGDPELSMLLAIEAASITYQMNGGSTSDAKVALNRTLAIPFRGVLGGNKGWINSASFSPDGMRIVTASNDGTARLWDLQGNLIVALGGHTGGVTSASFSPDGRWIVTVGNDGVARLWDADGAFLKVLEGHTDWVSLASFSPDGTRIATASGDGTARLWDVEGNLIAALGDHTDTVWSANFSPDGTRIVTASADGTARLWDGEGNFLTVLEGHTYSVRSATFSPDGTRIATTGCDDRDDGGLCTLQTARLWDSGGNLLSLFGGHTDWIYSASFSPDGTRIVTASDDGTARLWDGEGNFLTLLQAHTDGVRSASFSPDGMRIVTASNDGTARLWDVEGNLIAALEGHKDRVYSATFSPDGARIVTASADGTARLWDGEGRLLGVLMGSTDRMGPVTFSPDGTRIVAVSGIAAPQLWDADGKFLGVLGGHTDRVEWVSFDPDGTRIVTASWDGTARLWDADGNFLDALRGHTGPVWSASFSPDGTRIVTAGGDGTARLWRVWRDIDAMLAEARRRAGRTLTDLECQQYLHVKVCP